MKSQGFQDTLWPILKNHPYIHLKKQRITAKSFTHDS
jgi:hypothetical protein